MARTIQAATAAAAQIMSGRHQVDTDIGATSSPEPEEETTTTTKRFTPESMRAYLQKIKLLDEQKKKIMQDMKEAKNTERTMENKREHAAEGGSGMTLRAEGGHRAHQGHGNRRPTAATGSLGDGGEHDLGHGHAGRQSCDDGRRPRAPGSR